MSERDDALEEAAQLIEADARKLTNPLLLQLLASQARGIRLLKSSTAEPMTDNEIASIPGGLR